MPDEVSVNVEGSEALLALLKQFPDVVKKEIEAVINKGLYLLQAGAADYPPPPPGSTYRRTGTLGRLWTSAQHQIRVSGNALEGRIGNATPYGPYVQSQAKQAAIHQGRWKTIEQIMKEAEPEINELLDQAGANLAREFERR